MDSLTATEWFMFIVCIIGLAYGQYVMKKLKKDNTFRQEK